LWDGEAAWGVASSYVFAPFLFALLRASYEIKQEKDGLEERLENEERRAALNDLHGDAR
jgi:hypothetical protein